MGDFSYVYRPNGLSKHIVVEPGLTKRKGYGKRALVPGRTFCGRYVAEMLPMPPGKQLHLCEQCRVVRGELVPTP